MAPCRMVLAYRLVLTAIALSNGLEPTTGGSAHSDRWTRGQALPTATEAEECRGWLNGTLGTYNKPEMTNHKIRAHKGGFTSQHRQDKILYKHLFRNLSRTGIYADVAANHWKSLSNSYLFDRCLHWDGVCVEPNPIYQAGLLAQRTCSIVPHCVSNSTAAVDFHMGKSMSQGVYGGIGGRSGGSPLSAKLFETQRMKCVSLATVFAKAGITHIDFLSLDVEMHEAAALSSIDFSRVQIDYIFCETALWGDTEEQCTQMLPQLGYHRINFTESIGEVYWRRNGLRKP